MKVLVINAGSSSLKYQLIDMDTEKAIAKGGCERIGIDGSFCKHKANGVETTITSPMPTHSEAIQVVLNALVDSKYGAIKSMDEIDAVGHRIVHSGEVFNDSVLLTEENMKIIESLSELAPLHQPANIIGVRACQKIMPNVPMVGVFDTAFHSTMSEKAYIYGIPYEAYTEHKVRRYGFHGTSHRFVSEEAAKYLHREGDKDFKVVTMHLGNGSSISAVKGGKSMDTSMSFTPLGGVPMGTRSGDLDPAIVEFLSNKYKMSVSETLNFLNKKSGVMGLSGVSSDFRDLSAAKKDGNHRAELAIDVFTYSCKKYLGSYMAALGGADCIVFTAGIGEHDASIRKAITENMEFFGIKIDDEKNEHLQDGICDITAKDGKVKVLVIPTNEELVIARDTKRLAK